MEPPQLSLHHAGHGDDTEISAHKKRRVIENEHYLIEAFWDPLTLDYDKIYVYWDVNRSCPHLVVFIHTRKHFVYQCNHFLGDSWNPRNIVTLCVLVE